MSEAKLAKYFREKGAVLVAFSGGVDSSVLAKAAYDALGDDALAVTFNTPLIPRSELSEAEETAKLIGIRHIKAGYGVFDNRRFTSNPPNRCYLCKKMMAKQLKKIAAEHGIGFIAEGTNADDLRGQRPGYRALREAGVSTPLAELRYTKEMVRSLARKYGLDYDKPSAACLSSRIPFGWRITPERLSKVEESEDFLRSLGVTQVRVRLTGQELDEARIEVYAGEFHVVLKNAGTIVRRLPFRKVSLDLQGYS